MQVRIIVPVQNFAIEDNSEMIISGLLLTNDQKIIHHLWQQKYFLESTGKVVLESMGHSRYFFFYEGDLNELPQFAHFTNIHKLCENVRSLFQAFISGLWYERDNSSFVVKCIVEEIDKDLGINTSDTYNSRHDGLFYNEKFSVSEILNSIDKSNQIDALRNIAQTAGNPLNEGLPNVSIPTELNDLGYKFNRLDRALRMLALLRSNGHIIYKITFGVAIIECLFTTTTSELTHQASERVALFLSGTQSEMIDNYLFLKKCYNIRSKYVHGSVVSESVDVLKNYSERLDKILRIIFNLIKDDPTICTISDSDLDEYFRKLIFR